jgi:polo-like kinase 4
MYESDSKFTMMANSPDADIEVVFYSSEDGSRSQQSEGGRVSDRTNVSSPLRALTMRIKIMRSRQLVEISRQVFAATKVHGRVNKSGSKDSPLREKEGEWKKIVLVAPGGSIDAADQTSLDGYEKEGLERTEAFLAVCRIVESGLVEDGGRFHGETSGSSGSSSSVLVCKTLPVEQHDNGIPRESGSIGLTRKLGHSLTPTTSVPSLGWNKDRHGFPFEPPSLIRQPGKFETRFIPSVGWCVRYTGPSGGAGRYRMMFFDGKTLEVDVDEECVEMMDSVRDEIVRLVHWYRVFLNLRFTWSGYNG